MGSLNVAEWSPDQVAEWMKGLGGSVAGYAERMRARGVGGARLLALRCDDLEGLGVRAIGHQELVLEGVEQLRNFQYELSRECVQQLALRVSVCAGGAARALRAQAHTDQRLETQALMDVARAVAAVKTLVCWLERMVGAAGLRGRAGALLALCLEACTCAQRDRFAEQPARAVAAAARAAATLADHIVQDVSDPLILQPASLEQVTLAQGARPLGFAVVPSCGGYQQLAAIRFGSPAHASGAVLDGDEIVQVGSVCVIGWSGAAVERACSQRGAGGELTLRLRRRTQRPPTLPAHQQLRNRSRLEALEASRALLEAPAPREDASSSDSEPLSPPASPTAPPDHTRMYPPKPRALARRRHSVSCASPTAKRPPPGIEQFWQELAQQRWRAGGSAGGSPEPLEALYRRDKAVSCSTGLELSPRPRTCLGVALNHPLVQKLNAARLKAEDDEARDARNRGKLDKSHSTPAYDFDGGSNDEPGSLATQTIPESPTTPTDSPTILVHSAEKADQILDFKKSSSQIEEAILQQKSRRLTDERNEFSFTDERDESREAVETINTAAIELHAARRASLKSPSEGHKLSASDHVRIIQEEATSRDATRQLRPPPVRPEVPPEPPPRPLATQRPILREPPLPPAEAIREYPALRPVRPPEEPSSPLKPVRLISKHDIRVLGERRELPPLNAEDPPTPAPGGGLSLGAGFPGPPHAPHAPGGVRGMFPTYKSKSLKKKNSLLAKRRCVAARALAGRGAGGAVWQRVRARHAQQPRWARRYLLLCDSTLYAYRSAECSRADCMIQLAGFTAAAAGEVKSRPHAFKVYHTGTAFYFACETADTARAWLALIQRATHEHAAPQTTGETPKQYSETDYSTDSDAESERSRDRERDRDKEKEKEKDKSKFGSLKKLTHRMQRSESSEAVGGPAASLDRKYLRFFSRARHKDDKPAKSKQSNVPVPTEHYRSYRRVSQHDTPPSPPTILAPPPTAPRLPKPINYIHASNPNLLDFEKSEFVTRPSPRPLPLARPKVHKPDNFVGFVTLEEFMLKKQEEERRQVYTNRVLLGVERGERDASLQRRLREVVPDVLYGALPPSALPAPLAELQARSLPRAPPPPRRDAPGKPVSVKGKDGYEKIVYTEEKPGRVERMRRASPPAAAEHPQQPPPEPPRWRDSLRRNDKVHSGAGAGAGAGTGAGAGGARRVAPLAPLAAAAAVESVAAGGGAGAGVSRLRLMFGGRSLSRETHRQESAPAAQAGTPPGGATAPGSPGVAPGVTPGVAPGVTAGVTQGVATASEWAWRTAQYPHLQCPPTFQPESYSLASRLARPPPPPPD